MFNTIFSKKIILFILLGLSYLLTSCATTHAPAGTSERIAVQESNSELGVRYLLGRSVTQDNEKAFYYFRKAAKEGDPFAENELAYLYAAGKGTPQDWNKAFIYYQQAAKHNLASAQYNLGLLYLHGLGTEKNKELGMEWINKAAEHGFLPAKHALLRNRN
jgi:TPR repeat protein